MSRARWSDHFINLSRANPLNLESGPIMGTTEPVICATLASPIPSRQMCVAIGVLQDSALLTPAPVPNKKGFTHLFADLMPDGTEFRRGTNNCGMVTHREGLSCYTRDKCVHYTTAMTGPGKSACTPLSIVLMLTT